MSPNPRRTKSNHPSKYPISALHVFSPASDRFEKKSANGCHKFDNPLAIVENAPLNARTIPPKACCISADFSHAVKLSNALDAVYMLSAISLPTSPVAMAVHISDHASDKFFVAPVIPRIWKFRVSAKLFLEMSLIYFIMDSEVLSITDFWPLYDTSI